ncbi:hypothetical protein PACILC2_30400 [Paenibacillus cisolokensis]|uniref:Homoserine O-succinyltransferase n=1 Tax=Paenibacillus cisolokensis TaxID=1658519 RepID=A0ABQ4N893_9BACL|nr:hypothetical protein PACILC2_30400 [Paenibacillus cisolokensis]
MPIKVPDNLPAKEILNNENIFVMDESVAYHQDIRPLRIAILNLMPTKETTETQLLRLIGNTPLQVEIVLIHPRTHTSKNTSAEHLKAFYKTFDDISDQYYDGMIITGAPVEHLPFEQVDYWDELKEIMDWSVRRVTSTLHICWASQAGLYHHYGVPKYDLPEKYSGYFRIRSRSRTCRCCGASTKRSLSPNPAIRRCAGKISRRCLNSKFCRNRRKRAFISSLRRTAGKFLSPAMPSTIR